MKIVFWGAGYSALQTIGILREKNQHVQIIGTSRSEEGRSVLEAQDITTYVFDGGQVTEDLSAALMDATHFVISVPPGENGDPVFYALRGQLADLTALKWVGYYSTTGVYDSDDGALVNENSPLVEAGRSYGRVQAERQWAGVGNSFGFCALRLGGIYGPQRSVFDRIKRGGVVNIIKHGQMFNRIHVRDIAAITALALEQSLVGVYNIVDGAPSSSESVNNYAAHKMGLPDLPEVAFDVAEMSPMARSFYEANRVVSNAAIKQALGYKFIYPDYRAGLDAMWEDAKSDSNAD